jgi:hypothetical protein
MFFMTDWFSLIGFQHINDHRQRFILLCLKNYQPPNGGKNRSRASAKNLFRHADGSYLHPKKSNFGYG